MASIYDERQQDIIDAATDIRMVGITHLKNKWKDADPTIGEMRVGSEMASGLESQINNEVNITAKLEKDQADSADVAMISQLLQTISKENIALPTPEERTLEVPDDIIDVDIVPGHMSGGRSSILLEEILPEIEGD